MSCSFPKCPQDDTITWLNHPLCDKHWAWVCEHKKEESFKKLGETKMAETITMAPTPAPTPVATPEKPKRGRKRIEIPEAKELLASGMKIKAIAEKLKLPYQKVYHYLKCSSKS